MKFQGLLFIFLLVNCAGYNVKSKNNPLQQYGISKLAVPAFYNQSNIPHASPVFTRELITFLRQFKGLEVQNELNENSDAVLIGIIESADKYKHTVTSVENRVTSDIAPNAISETQRGEFYIPAITQVNLKVRFILLKRPTLEMIEFVKKDIAKSIKYSENIIFNQEVSLSDSFNREIFDSEAKRVNATQNRKALQRTVRDLAFAARDSFSELVLYVF